MRKEWAAVYTLDQLEILMLVAEAEDPLDTALSLRMRWQYILQVAEGASRGLTLDSTLPHVVRDSGAYHRRARQILSALDEWLHDYSRRTLPDAS